MLICRENLTLDANMKLPDKMSWRQNFERVEQVMELVMKSFLQEGQQHVVYKPGKHTQTFGTNFPNSLKKTESSFPTTTPRTSLRERLEDFNSHVKATQEVVKERTEELINCNETDPKKRKIAFKNVSAKVMSKLKEKNNHILLQL